VSLPRYSIPKRAKFQKIELPDGLDFSTLFQVIQREEDYCFLLESAGENSYDSRYSVIGFSPIAKIIGKEQEIQIDSLSYPVENPYFSLRELADYNSLNIGYTGGLVGYLSYDAMSYFEPSLKIKSHSEYPKMEFGLYEDGLLYDKFTGSTEYFWHLSNRIERIKDFVAKAVDLQTQKFHARPNPNVISKETHKNMVLEALEEIKAGNTFQCQIGFEESFQVSGESFLLYLELKKINPSPHMFYLRFGKRVVLGASPELLFRLRQKEMESFPLAGTTRRGNSLKEDQALAQSLLMNPKEIAEHNMLIDLHRNDVGRVAKFGTVKVRRRFDIKKFSHVQHISSEVVGILRNEEDMFSGLAYSFPAGTLSGAPKIESMKIIDRIEISPRGPYGGAVGVFGWNGDCTFAIPIRSFFISNSIGFVRASGGIVLDSQPESEYEEIQNKMASVKKALIKFQ